VSYFAAIKITDVNGNVVELMSVDELLKDIRDELKAIRIILNEVADSNLKKEDIASED